MLLRKFLSGGSASSTSYTSNSPSSLLSAFLLFSALGALPVQATDVLETNGFSTCLATSDIKVDKMNVKYDRANSFVTFDLAGSSTREQKVKAVLTVTAYGKQVYEKTIDPCVQGIAQLCPLPKGTFAAKDTMDIPPEFASMIPAIAFQIPDLDGMAKLELRSSDDDKQLACLQSVVQNGKTASQPGVQYVTAGIAAATLVLSGVSALGAAGTGTGAGPSPNFGDVMFWFQNVAMNGMLSVNYPPVYRSFVSNFAWSTGIISWDNMQRSIDGFRKATGGHLEKNSIDYLMNATLVFNSNSSTETGNATTSNDKTRRALDWTVAQIFERAVEVNGTAVAGNGTNSTSTDAKSKVMHYVSGIQAYVEKLQIPSANTFMTILLIFAIVLATIAVCILLFKVILEAWSLFGSFPKSLTGFRKRYWGFLATTIVRLLLVLYGTWTLYCFYQFKNGDSWGAHVLAGVTLAVFTGILGFFAVRIFILARRQKAIDDENEAAALKQDGEHKPYDKLFEHKPYMRRYGLFYDQFKTDFWWIFLPLIIYAFAKGAFIALGDGHGLVQTAGQLGCEVVLLVLLLWNRPYNSKAGNVLNTIIAVVRVLSVVCLIVFVEELNIAADTKTVTGVALIVIQSVLTAALAICIAVNAIIVMCKENPHDKRRKELEKQREADNLTPLGPRHSILGAPIGQGLDGKGRYSATPTRDEFLLNDASGRTNLPLHHMTPAPPPQHPFSHNRSASSSTDRQGLVSGAAPMPLAHGRQESQGGYDEYRLATYRGAPAQMY
ncbi:TRP-domain-containing protein [Choiromyces venosus 120613-1]|uniref:TRP-domain-containing protein n=1 Tax=Choiromyces venosus 120613-1 TaxID=1336337 RepID=A0A3N4J8W8_9PEZI|nr:TRP-domain-containing protein [Choiromyces venosus 120613-1]